MTSNNTTMTTKKYFTAGTLLAYDETTAGSGTTMKNRPKTAGREIVDRFAESS